MKVPQIVPQAASSERSSVLKDHLSKNGLFLQEGGVNSNLT